MSKYIPLVLKVLSKSTIKSTNEVLNEVESESGKTVNWYVIHRILSELASEGKVERLKSKAGFFWKLA